MMVGVRHSQAVGRNEYILCRGSVGFRRQFLAVLVVLVLSVSLLQGEGITFDPPLKPGGVTPMDDWLERGMLFTGPKGFSQYDSGRSLTPDNGSAYLHFTKGPKQTLKFRLVDSTPFRLINVDLAEYSTFFPERMRIRFDCHKTDGTVETTSFNVDGRIDGPGGILDFETFTFRSEFTEISFVEVPTTTYSMDNVMFERLPGYESLIGLEITGPNDVEETTSRNYEAIALFESGNTLNLTWGAAWSLDPDTHASIDENGLLRTEDLDVAEDITINAQYSVSDVTLNAEILVRISLHTPRRLHVPEQYYSIQAAIDQSVIGDEIIVQPGRYYENINLKGKRITLRSSEPTDRNIVASTIIDGASNGSVVTFTGEELADCVLSGFTLTNGTGNSYVGGGIMGNGTEATIEYNIISGNQLIPNWSLSSVLGGGLFDCDGIIRYNVISENKVHGSDAASDGGGLYGCDGIIHNNLVANNEAFGFYGGRGGGFYNCNGYILNNTVVGNSADDGGGFSNCAGTIENCIVWGNRSEQMDDISIVRYSDVQGGWPGLGNIDTDPWFADANDEFFVPGGYHLKSQAGRYDPTTDTWVIDDVASPCIDAGNPMSAIGPEPFPNGGIINMGAYGGTSEASKSYFGKAPCEIVVAGDVNGDCEVNFLDLRLMGVHWCEDNSP